MTTQKTNLLALGFDALRSFVVDLGWKRYRADQILSWIYKRHAGEIEAMTDLSMADRCLLSEKATLAHLRILTRLKSIDGTEKFLFELADGKQIESVLIPEARRRTLCISSQAGCTLDCTFCLTALEGLKRNLKADEIVNQFLTVQALLPEGEAITNEELLELPCEILVPAALGGQFTAANAPAVQARLIVEGANGPTTGEADRVLQERGVFIVPDILANAGGVIVSYFEWVQDLQFFFWKEDEVNSRLRDILTGAFHRTLGVARREGVDLRTAAMMEAVSRVARATKLRGIYP